MDDLISRQEAADVVNFECGELRGLAKTIIGKLEALPSAQTEVRVQMSSADCISRQTVLKLLHALPPEEAMTKALLIQGVKQMDAVQPVQRWIPCEKGEPDEDTECWVTVKTTDVLYRGNFTKRYGERRDKGFITSGGFMWWNTALAWMPIYEPEPYKEEEP